MTLFLLTNVEYLDAFVQWLLSLLCRPSWVNDAAGNNHAAPVSTIIFDLRSNGSHNAQKPAVSKKKKEWPTNVRLLGGPRGVFSENLVKSAALSEVTVRRVGLASHAGDLGLPLFLLQAVFIHVGQRAGTAVSEQREAPAADRR